jgi:hypothetical protein
LYDLGEKNMKIENTFIATIYIGAREGYSDIIHSYDEAKEILQKYCGEVSYCVTLTQTEFIYKNGNEPGFIVGLINYPRFPSTPEEITQKALDIAEIFLKEFNQLKISVVCSDKTYMIEKS